MNEAAQKLYVLGHPVGHSKSPVMYNAVYGHLGLPWSYGLMDLPEESDARDFLDRRDFLSINITTPYKPHAFEAATIRAASAKLAKGANVLVRKGDVLIAFNTDGQGCVAYLEREGVRFRDAAVVICGTGPTSLSILHAVALAGAQSVLLVGRDADRAQGVLDDYLNRFELLATATIDLPPAKEGHRSFLEALRETEFSAGSYADSAEAIAQADVVIDATSLGMREGDPAPFDTSLLHEGQTAFDVVYGHGETAFVAGARRAGCRVFTGGGMLVGQAVVTAQTVLDIAGVDYDLSFDEMFSLMAKAAGFDIR